MFSLWSLLQDVLGEVSRSCCQLLKLSSCPETTTLCGVLMLPKDPETSWA